MWSAWILMSVAWPARPPPCPPAIRGWWIRISELGSANRLPLAPLASRKAPIEAAIPMQMVDTSHLIYCMVSWMAMPALMDPPGLLIYRLMSLSGSCPSRYSSCATTKLAEVSLTSSLSTMMRSFKRREKMSYERSPWAVCSTT